jgi:hypothetical protein
MRSAPIRGGARAARADDARRTASQLAGRVIFGGYFLYKRNQSLRPTRHDGSLREKQGVKWPNGRGARAGALLVIGGVSMLAGRQKVGASLLTTFLTGVTPMMHDFGTSRIRVSDERNGELHEEPRADRRRRICGGGSAAPAAAHARITCQFQAPTEPFDYRAPLR